MTTPPWSGVFWTDHDERRGFMSVHMDDPNLYSEPPGWKLEGSHLDEDDQAEVFVYVRV